MPINDYNATVAILRAALGARRHARYRAIADALARAIGDGSVPAGSKLPPVRTLAYALGVSMGTALRVYAEVERLGLAASRTGDGTYALGPAAVVAHFRNTSADRIDVVDLTRNLRIPGDDVPLLAGALADLAREPERLRPLVDYVPEGGLPEHRAAGAHWLRHSRIDVAAERVVVSNGTQHGLLCALMAVTQTRDVVATEGLGYPGLREAADALGLSLVGLAMDDQGLIPDALEERCRRRPVAVLFTMPTVHNPTTVTMPWERRQAIAAVCRRHNVLVIEDDAHGVLADDHPPGFAALIPERAVTLGGLTKAASPGLRVGYVAAPADLVGPIAAAVRSTCWMATPLAAEVAARWIGDGTADRLREEQRRELRRRKALVAPLLAGINVATCDDAGHFWIAVPPPLTARRAAGRLADRGVLVKTGDAFAFARGFAGEHLRASVGGVLDDGNLIAAFGLIAETLNDAVQASGVPTSAPNARAADPMGSSAPT